MRICDSCRYFELEDLRHCKGYCSIKSRSVFTLANMNCPEYDSLYQEIKVEQKIDEEKIGINTIYCSNTQKSKKTNDV